MAINEYDPHAVQALLTEIVAELAPDEDLAPFLLLAAGCEAGGVLTLDARLFQPPRSIRFYRDQLPGLIRQTGADRAMLVTSTWVADIDPLNLDELAAFRRHIASGGRLFEWPTRCDAISALRVERNAPPRTFVATLERHVDRAPTIRGWHEDGGFEPELERALQLGVGADVTGRSVRYDSVLQ